MRELFDGNYILAGMTERDWNYGDTVKRHYEARGRGTGNPGTDRQTEAPTVT